MKAQSPKQKSSLQIVLQRNYSELIRIQVKKVFIPIP